MGRATGRWTRSVAIWRGISRIQRSRNTESQSCTKPPKHDRGRVSPMTSLTSLGGPCPCRRRIPLLCHQTSHPYPRPPPVHLPCASVESSDDGGTPGPDELRLLGRQDQRHARRRTSTSLPVAELSTTVKASIPTPCSASRRSRSASSSIPPRPGETSISRYRH